MPNLSKKVKVPLVKVKVLRHHQEMSVRTLIIFVLAFGVIGYFIFHSFAAAPLVASLEAEQMTLPAGALVVNDSSASGGQAIKMTSNSKATGSVNFPSSVSSVTVKARGDQCSGAPAMTITLDGTNLFTNTAVSATSWTSYSVTPTASIASGTHSLSVSFNNAYSFAGHGKKGNGACTRSLYIDVTDFYGPTTPPPPAPTVALSASPTSVTAGQSSTLTWSSTNSTSCTASGTWSGTEPTSGSISTGAINQTSTYSLTCTGSGGSATASTTVTVSSSPPAISISASPTNISAGQSSTLAWSTANATSCTASGAWSGSQATSGSQSVSPTSTSTYSLTCTGNGGTSTASATVTVGSSGSGDPSTLHSALGFNTLNATSDDFNGTAGSLPSSTRWGAKTFTAPSGTVWGGWTNISEDGQGDLVIKAVKNSSGVWTSGFLTGKTGYSGARYVEARAKVPCGYGTWSGPIWEWGYPYGTAPMFENDVIEQLGKEPQAYHATLHNWNNGTNPQSGKTISTGITLCNGFHYYGAAVYSDHVDFYFDGTKVASTLASAIGLSDLTTWNQVINISQNMGGWGGTPTVSSPVTLLVDYIRVYTK